MKIKNVSDKTFNLDSGPLSPLGEGVATQNERNLLVSQGFAEDVQNTPQAKSGSSDSKSDSNRRQSSDDSRSKPTVRRIDSGSKSSDAKRAATK